MDSGKNTKPIWYITILRCLQSVKFMFTGICIDTPRMAAAPADFNLVWNIE